MTSVMAEKLLRGKPQISPLPSEQRTKPCSLDGCPMFALTCPGLPWGVHGPKTDSSNAFAPCETTLHLAAPRLHL
jgi:hypothetical protein